MPRDALLVVAWTATLCWSVLLHGQGPASIPDQAGVWKPATYVNHSPGTPIGKPPASAGELDALRKVLTSLEQAVHDTAMLTPPRGFDVQPRQRLDRGCPGDPVLCRQAPLAGWLDFEMEPYTSLNGTVTTRKGSPPDLEVAFNDPRKAYAGHHAGSDLSDAAGNMFVGPLIEIERVGNASILDTGVVVLGRHPRPLFVEASREQYLRALTARYASTPPLAGELRDQLAALSPEQRRSPAYIDGVGQLTAAPFYDKSPPLFMFTSRELAALSPEQRRATPLFIFNPAYFDPALPRTAIQLITVCFLCARDTNLETARQKLNDRPDLLERSALTPDRLAFLATSGVDVESYRIFELTRRLNYSALHALLAVPAAPNKD
jgi:hypothetical protein